MEVVFKIKEKNNWGIVSVIESSYHYQQIREPVVVYLTSIVDGYDNVS
jgi:hypothetical protein